MAPSPAKGAEYANAQTATAKDMYKAVGLLKADMKRMEDKLDQILTSLQSRHSATPLKRTNTSQTMVQEKVQKTGHGKESQPVEVSSPISSAYGSDSEDAFESVMADSSPIK